MKLARDVRNGWGVQVPLDKPARVASALAYLGTRWVRAQFNGDNTEQMLDIQRALVATGAANPNLRLQVLLNAYLQNAGGNTWNAQRDWLSKLLASKIPTGRSIVGAIEGPNEINNRWTGGGSRGPNDQTDKTGPDALGAADNPLANANFVDWAVQLAAFCPPGGTVEILSPTIIYFMGQNFSPALNVSALVDYGTFHYYAGVGGTTGVPSYPPNPGNGSRTYGYAQAGICPGKALVQSEGGCSTEMGAGGYGQDGRSAARYHLLQLFDHHVVGGHRYMVYNLFNNPVSVPGAITSYNEDNFGLYYGDGVTPKPPAIALHNLANLLSLNLDYSDPANLTDTALFTPLYDESKLRITGLQSAGTAGSQLVMPKSDGSTMIAIWNEPPIDSGGQSLSPMANVITVDFGSMQDYAVYDPTGGGGVVNFTARSSTFPIATGRAQAVNLTLYGSPLLVELRGPRGGDYAFRFGL